MMKLTKAQIEGLLTIIGEGHVAHINTRVFRALRDKGAICFEGKGWWATPDGYDYLLDHGHLVENEVGDLVRAS